MPYNFPLVETVVMKLERSNLDNLVDRTHYLFTVGLLSLFALFNAGNLLFGSPIQCMAPSEYSDGWVAFVNEYCFVTSTYVTEGGSFVPDVGQPRFDVNYYQWFAYVLFLQSMLFYAPHFLWTSLQGKADVDVQGVVDHCVSLRKELNTVTKARSTDIYVQYLLKLVKQRKRDGAAGSGLGDTATLYYVGSKCLNLLNVFVQFHLINVFVGRGRCDWGFKVLRDAINGVYWDQTGFFPRLAFCEFPRNDLANTVAKEAQCVLMMNMINEKMFAFLYFWFLALFVVTLADLLYSLSIYLCDNVRLYMGRTYLSNVDQIAPGTLSTAENKENFVMETLGRDGLLLLRFIEAHAGTLDAAQVACRLFAVVNAAERDAAADAHPEEDNMGADKETVNAQEV